LIADFLDFVRQMVETVINTFGYPGIFIMMLTEHLFPPLPSEIVLPFGGFMVAEGRLSMTGILIAATIGSLAGASVFYYLGYKLGEDRLKKFIEKYGKFALLTENDLDRALEAFEKHEKWTILIGRLIPSVRSLISIPAGIKKMNLKLFLLLTLIGSAVWNSLLAGAGYFLGSNWDAVLNYLEIYETIILVALAILIGQFVIRRLIKNRKTAEASQ
jgi:membrane protein DedA with SNARE-associated domain